MNEPVGAERILRRLSYAAVFATAVICWISAIGWGLGRIVLASVASGFIPMAPSTAITFSFLIASWLALRFANRVPASAAISMGCAIIPAFASLLILVDSLGHLGIDVEEILVAHPVPFGQVLTGRMSPITALTFLLSCGSLLSLARLNRPMAARSSLPAGFGAAVFFIGFVMTVGYVYGVPILYGSAVVPVALTTAVAFALFGTALVFSSGASSWPVRAVIGSSLSARLLRAFLPLVLVMVLLQGWLGAVVVSRIGNPALASALMLIVALLVVGAAVARVARSIGGQVDAAFAERNEAERVLKQSEEKYRSFFNDDLAADCITTPEGRLIACNPAFLRLFGFESIEHARNTPVDFLYRNPEDRREFLRQIVAHGRIENYAIAMQRRDGTPIFVLANITGSFDKEGKLVEVKGFIVDETRRRELERQLVQAQELESLGTLAAGIAHDFNNILSMILGHAGIMERSRDRPDQVSRSIAAIETAAMRGAALVRQLLTFARKAEAVFEPVTLNECVSEAARLFRETFPKTIVVEARLAEDLPLISADPNQIHLALLNLGVNARDAMPVGGTLSITTSKVRGETLKRISPEVADRDYLRLDVSDTGHGMDAATRGRIFEPFFTTKEHGKGTGLGLAVVYGIVESHQGFVEVQSELGEGSTFRLFFPVAEVGAKPRAQELIQETNPLGGTETVLIVEDEEILRELVEEVLQMHGYRTVAAQDGEEAIAVYLRHRQEISLVLTDMGLPKLNGLGLIHQLRAVDPDLKIIAATGYLDPLMKSELDQGNVAEVIQKPYHPDELTRAVRVALDRDATTHPQRSTP